MLQNDISVTPWGQIDQSYDEGVDLVKPEGEEIGNFQNLLQEEEKKTETYQPKQEKKTKNCYRINTTKSRSELKLLRKIIPRNGWKEEHLQDQGDIMWIGMGLKEEDYTYCMRMLTNRFPGMRDLAHKTQTGFFLNKFRE